MNNQCCGKFIDTKEFFFQNQNLTYQFTVELKVLCTRKYRCEQQLALLLPPSLNKFYNSFKFIKLFTKRLLNYKIIEDFKISEMS